MVPAYRRTNARPSSSGSPGSTAREVEAMVAWGSDWRSFTSSSPSTAGRSGSRTVRDAGPGSSSVCPPAPDSSPPRRDFRPSPDGSARRTRDDGHGGNACAGAGPHHVVHHADELTDLDEGAGQ